MGYMFLCSSCCACERVIMYNPEHVPSLRIEGNREPLCQVCANKWNHIHRLSKGLEPVPIHPLAYEPQPEEGHERFF